MATAASVTLRNVMPLGGVSVATGLFQYSTDDDITVATGLSRVDSFRATCYSNADGPDCVAFLNSGSGANNDGPGGQVFLQDTTPQFLNTNLYRFIAVGK